VGVFSGAPLTTANGSGRAAQLRAMWGITQPSDLIPVRPGQQKLHPVVTADTALRNSAVWACLRLRADLLSTLPLHLWRYAPDGIQKIACPIPQVLSMPGGPRVRKAEWLFSSQWDVDRAGNVIGIIRERDGNGFPARIDLQLTSNVQVLTSDNEITAYRINGKLYLPNDIWHEKQYTVPGLPVGLSPVSYAALTLGRFLSIEDFALTWFGGGAVPRARLRNTAKKINTKEAAVVKESWRASVTAGEPFVHGSDWEYDLMQAEQSGLDWLEAQKASVPDIGRYFGVPADLLDAIVSTGATITYANITQRHLSFLITHLGPAVARREDALTTLTPAPRFVELDTDALLRMDPQTRAAYLKTMIDARLLAPSEGRALDGNPPFTQAQIDEFLTFWPPKGSVPAGAQSPGPAAITGEGTTAPAPTG
jgi:HK97 family phage portal protein